MIGEIGTHPKDGKPLLLVETQDEWRMWLEGNHEESSGVWFVSWKKATGKPFIPFTDAVDEALCFGWVDSKINKLDKDRAMRLFTPRNPKSPWSRINKEKVARLVNEGRMTASGMRLVEGAKADGSWNIYDEIENLVTPPDLVSALAKDSAAEGFFANFPDSSKKNILWWIKSARRPETRAARIAKMVAMAAENRMANHPTGRDKGPTRRSG